MFKIAQKLDITMDIHWNLHIPSQFRLWITFFINWWKFLNKNLPIIQIRFPIFHTANKLILIIVFLKLLFQTKFYFKIFKILFILITHVTLRTMWYTRKVITSLWLPMQIWTKRSKITFTQLLNIIWTKLWLKTIDFRSMGSLQKL